MRVAIPPMGRFFRARTSESHVSAGERSSPRAMGSVISGALLALIATLPGTEEAAGAQGAYLRNLSLPRCEAARAGRDCLVDIDRLTGDSPGRVRVWNDTGVAVSLSNASPFEDCEFAGIDSPIQEPASRTSPWLGTHRLATAESTLESALFDAAEILDGMELTEEQTQALERMTKRTLGVLDVLKSYGTLQSELSDLIDSTFVSGFGVFGAERAISPQTFRARLDDVRLKLEMILARGRPFEGAVNTAAVLAALREIEKLPAPLEADPLATGFPALVNLGRQLRSSLALVGSSRSQFAEVFSYLNNQRSDTSHDAFFGSSGFLVDVRSTPAPLCSFCGTGIDHCALA